MSEELKMCREPKILTEVGAENLKTILGIFETQLEIIKLASTSVVYLPLNLEEALQAAKEEK